MIVHYKTISVDVAVRGNTEGDVLAAISEIKADVTRVAAKRVLKKRYGVCVRVVNAARATPTRQ